MRHKTLMEEQITDLMNEIITFDGTRYRVIDVNPVRNGVYSLALRPKKGETRWVEVLTENNRVIYIDN